MVVEHIAIDRLCHRRSSTQTMTFHGYLIIHHPTGPVQIMHQRLNDIVSREPTEVILSAALPLKFSQPLFALEYTVGASQEILFNGYDSSLPSRPLAASALHQPDRCRAAFQRRRAFLPELQSWREEGETWLRSQSAQRPMIQ